MEPAKIDWKTVDSVFVPDDLYEHINAPKWVDFSALDESVDDDDDHWFCKPDCNHPKKVEDFLRGTPPSKLQRLSTVFEILPLGARNTSDVNLKRRGLVQHSVSSNKDSKCDRFVEDGENQHPNFCSTPSRQYNIMKTAIKSSTEKKQIDNFSQKEGRPRLKGTLSARNLFAGRDIMNQISEFCNELKRLATRTKERENVERSSGKSPMDGEKQEAKECSGGDDHLGQLDERGKERRKPLLEVSKEKIEAMKKNSVKEKQRTKKRVEEAENIPIYLDLKNVKQKEGENVMPIRTCPPSPQCFSAGHSPNKGTPLEAFKSRPQERRILQEMERSNTKLRKEAHTDSNNGGRTASIAVEKEARALDVFWFFKPCTQSS